ncbi:MAG: DNA translocase FtsK 4TM domain-containing protein, partial [Nakamurella sp.]
MSAIGRGIGSVWRLIARGLGGLVRALGRGAGAARKMDSAHHRDGIALGLIAIALICAIGSWFHAAGPVGSLVDDVARVWIGSIAVVLPVLLLIPAVVLMRSDDRERRTTPRIVGSVALTLGVSGMFDVVHESNLGDRADSVAARKGAGGTLGWLLGHPLSIGIHAVPAILVLALFCVYGMLLLTGIPLVQLPGRIHSWFGAGKPSEAAADGDQLDHEAYLAGGTVQLDPDADLSPTRLRRPSRRRVSAESADTPTETDEQPTLDDQSASEEQPTEVLPRRRWRAPAAEPNAGELADSTSPTGPIRRRVDKPAVADIPQPPVNQPTQLTLDRAVDGTYQLPPATFLKLGAPPKQRSSVNDEMIERIDTVLEQFNVDAAVTG